MRSIRSRRKSCHLPCARFCELLRAVNARVNVPVIISGGYAEPADLARADAAGASGVAIADALHWDRSTLSVIKRQAHELGLEVRL